MKNIYDNGAVVLGSIIDIKEYITSNCEDFEEVIARYWVNCFDRELVLILNDINLTNKDIG